MNLTRIKPQKYGNQRTVVDGVNFPSKLEAKYYMELKLRLADGEIAYFLRQVPFHLPGGVVYRVDFMEVYPDGTIKFMFQSLNTYQVFCEI